MHLFHKWTIIKKHRCFVGWTWHQVKGDNLGGESEAVAFLEKCARCGKERGRIQLLSGQEKIVDPIFLTDL